MNKTVLKAIALILLVVIGASSCTEYNNRIRYKTKFRHHRDYYHYRGAGKTF